MERQNFFETKPLVITHYEGKNTAKMNSEKVSQRLSPKDLMVNRAPKPFFETTEKTNLKITKTQSLNESPERSINSDPS